MKIINFKKPKKTIINILIVISVISIIINLLALASYTLWSISPKTVSKIDSNIPDYYSEDINKLYSNFKNPKNKEEKIKYAHSLYEELKDISTLNKFYKYRQEVSKFLINYYKKSDISQSAIISKKWEQEHPHDFDAKFIYFDILTKTDSNETLNYIESLYTNYPDIKKVKTTFIDYLIDTKRYNKALYVEFENNDMFLDDIRFQIFYLDDTKNFSEQQSVDFRKPVYDDIYHISFNKTFKSLNGIRVDIDSLMNGSIVSNVKLSINNIVTDISSINHLKKLQNDKYEIIGNDPFFIFDIPKELKNYSGDVKIDFFSNIEKSDKVTSTILNNWKLLLDKNTLDIRLKKEDSSFVFVDDSNYTNISDIKLLLPPLEGLKIDNLYLKINDTLYNLKEIQGISDINKTLVVSNKTPSIVIDTKEKIDINKISLKINFNGFTNE